MNTSVDYTERTGNPRPRSEADSVGEAVRVQVLMPPPEAEQFEAYCHDRGHKKSTLIVRLIREHLAREGYSAAPAGRRRAS